MENRLLISPMQNNPGLRAKAGQLPDSPGVYLMKDEHGEIIYCGKAICLKKRVATYFRANPDLDPRKMQLCAQVKDIEYIVTHSELESLILECNLIKKHRPRFNVLLRDDKNYPHLCINPTEPFPSLRIVRRIRRDKSLYFGPYIPAKALRETLKAIHQIFPLRRCNKVVTNTQNRPCLNYQMGLCCAPCAGLITQTEYNNMIQEVILFLQGKKDDLLKRLKAEMAKAASDLRYEEAATMRDQINAVESCMEKQHVFLHSLEDEDYFAFAREGERACVQIFFIRFGKMTGRKTLHIFNSKDISDGELMGIVLKQFYEEDKTLPPRVLVQHKPHEYDLIREWLSNKRGSRVRLLVPQRGKRRQVMQIAQKNALAGLNASLSFGEEGHENLLRQAQQDLKLLRLPRVIEGFDISNLGQTGAVGSMVSWRDGVPVKSSYRRFKIKTVQGIDDYGMMAEVIKRRYTRLKSEGGLIPDLILLDGGKGHLHAGLQVLGDLGLSTIHVVSLAKQEELIFLPHQDLPLNLPSHSPTLQLLQRIRDEAHRFAVSYQRVRRKKRVFSSCLDAIPGVGKKRRELLLKHFHGLDAMQRASYEELLSVRGIDRKTARAIYEHFCKK